MTALTYLIHVFLSLFFFFVLSRFLLQLMRADFYNPFSQACVKITNPFLKPLRMVIPGMWGIDLASVFLLFLIQLIHAEVLALVTTGTLANIATVLVFSIFGTIMYITWMIWVCAIIVIIASFVAPHSAHPILMLMRQFLQPFLNPFQRLLPPMGGLDFSIMLLLIFNRALQMLISELVVGFDPYGAVMGLIIGF